MGKLVYNTSGHSFDIEDRTLSHLRVVFMNKLRRGEPFMFHFPMGDGSGTRSLWISPSIPLVFHFYGSRAPQLNRRWIDDLMNEASTPQGLSVVAEPDPDSVPSLIG
ncbi:MULTISPECIES: ATP-dependent DNA ligase [Microbacterium]|uniref:ATP-dependent DNA ligase n=1 Tax=Microbacterium algihabitans TaxID=3075992 RepID=A0ABU3RSF3_9MICO|nr:MULTISPECIES: ATP-dependent DNA ligase [Microbacterium]MCD2168877.1 ATP-dependent DNA ligase [Microbacterium sp. JC 701]MDU0325720.1 ATP-dependent DNA ligase [Microbacterium sp. KSW2-21]